LERCGKIVVRRERKGHGGKTVTVIDGLGLKPSQLETLARSLRRAFGCGARVDAGRVILQGDRGPALAAWLRERGARQVVSGN
jgi:translation initiation factor 1